MTKLQVCAKLYNQSLSLLNCKLISGWKAVVLILPYHITFLKLTSYKKKLEKEWFHQWVIMFLMSYLQPFILTLL